MGKGNAFLVMRICVFGNANMCNWQCQDTGTMNRSPTPGGVFCGVSWVGVTLLVNRSQRVCNLFDIHS